MHKFSAFLSNSQLQGNHEMYFIFQIFGIGIKTKQTIEKPGAGKTGRFLTKANKITTKKY